MGFVRIAKGGIELSVWVVPRASRPGVGPLHGERLRIAVSAPPVEGAANEAVRELVAAALGVPRGDVTVLSGAAGRNKVLRVSGDSAALSARAEALGGAVPLGRELEKSSRKR